MSDRKDKILDQARKRFALCQDYESTARANAKHDVKFANGDALNKDQWTPGVIASRVGDAKGMGARPMLTINKTRQHCLQIINDARQNKPGVQVRPAGGAATADSAQIFGGIIRHIEYISNAQAAYDNATWGQVTAGIGYWRLVTDYANENSFDQEIFIRRVGDLFSVYIDPDCQQADKSDARYGFVFDDMPRDKFEAEYPKYADKVSATTISSDSDWSTRDHVRVAEYFYREEKKDTLIALPDGNTVRESMLDDMMRAQIEMFEAETGQELRRRAILTPEIKWCKIAGSEIIEETPWMGKYIPLIPVIGEEIVIDGVMDRKGHVRSMIDPQRQLNYWTSAAAEAIALAPKAPFIGAKQAFAGNEGWTTANTQNHAFLTYNHMDEDGNPLPKPERQMPPETPQAMLAGVQMAEQGMMLVSGQYQAIMGAPSNETSGKAINARQRQGDNATYQYIDRLAQAIRNTGKQLIDLIPKVYDTPRVMKILARDGSQRAVQIDPQHGAASTAQQAEDAPEFNPDEVSAIFNPSVGEYDVVSDTGPAYATARQEAFNAYGQLIAQNPQAFQLLGDLWLKEADFPTAEEAAKRLQAMLPMQAKGGPPPEMQQMQQQFQQMAQAGQAEIQQLQTALGEAQRKLSDQSADIERKDYEAETNRMKAMGSIDPEALKPLIREAVSQAVGQAIVPLMMQHAQAEQAMMPQPMPQPMAPQPEPQPMGIA